MANRLALFLKTKHIGDSIILTSAIEALPPDFLVDVLCFKDSQDIFAMHPKVRHVYVVPRFLKGFAKLFAYLALFKKMKSYEYALLAQFSDDWRGAIISRLLKAKHSVARATHRRPGFWHASFSDIAKRPLSNRPAAELDVDLIRKVGLYGGDCAPVYRLEPSESSVKRVDEWLLAKRIDKTKKLIVIHAAARWKFKGLPSNTWHEVIHGLVNLDYQVILSGASSDYEFNKEILRDLSSDCFIAQNFDLSMSAALLQKADLLISIDSMMIHMASAIQVPTIAIFGPTNDLIWAPWRVEHKVVVVDQNLASCACRPCGLDGCGGSKISQCLFLIDGDRIISATKEILLKR